MNSFLLILAGFLVADVVWWRWADVRAARLPARWLWRPAVACWAAGQVAYVVAVVATNGKTPTAFPTWYAVAAYLWHLFVLPATLLAAAPFAAARWRRRRRAARRRQRSAAVPDGGPGVRPDPAADVPAQPPTPPTRTPRPTRRQALAAAAGAAVAPLAASALTAGALGQLGRFRVRRAVVPVPALPADLDGLTIAHVSDLHVGKFLRPGMPARVADAVNALAADLVVFTGDLLDLGSFDGMPQGMAFLARLDPRHGLGVIEGNHDLMVSAERFEAEVKAAGLPLLVDEAVAYRLPRRATPVQFLGVTWGEWKLGRDIGLRGKAADMRVRAYSEEATAAAVARVAALREPGAFPILLAHHPHAFDPAAAAGIPLTLSGHTHGGQLMLTDHIGGGPLRFRYWTGLYERAAARLFVNNGVGAWFPLRVNAPAEVVHLTLRRG